MQREPATPTASENAISTDHIDRQTLQRLRRYSDRSSDDIARQMAALDREWDINSALELQSAAIGLTGLVLGVVRDRRWLVLSGAALSLLAIHALRGWSPPVPVLRRLGVRTRREIEREKYALKGMRGDFDGATGRSQVAWRAVRDGWIEGHSRAKIA